MNFRKFLYGNNHQIPLPIKVEAFPNSGALDAFPQVTAGSVAASGSASKARGLRGLVWLFGALDWDLLDLPCKFTVGPCKINENHS